MLHTGRMRETHKSVHNKKNYHVKKNFQQLDERLTVTSSQRTYLLWAKKILSNI